MIVRFRWQLGKWKEVSNELYFWNNGSPDLLLIRMTMADILDSFYTSCWGQQKRFQMVCGSAVHGCCRRHLVQEKEEQCQKSALVLVLCILLLQCKSPNSLVIYSLQSREYLSSLQRQWKVYYKFVIKY